MPNRAVTMINGTMYLGELAAAGGVDRVAMRSFPLLLSKIIVCSSPPANTQKSENRAEKHRNNSTASGPREVQCQPNGFFVRAGPSHSLSPTLFLATARLRPVPCSFPSRHLHWTSMIPTLTWTPEGVRFIDQTD